MGCSDSSGLKGIRPGVLLSYLASSWYTIILLNLVLVYYYLTYPRPGILLSYLASSWYTIILLSLVLVYYYLC